MKKMLSVLIVLASFALLGLLCWGLTKSLLKEVARRDAFREAQIDARKTINLKLEGDVKGVTSDLVFLEAEYSFSGVSQPIGYYGTPSKHRSAEIAYLLSQGVRDTLASMSAEEIDEVSIKELESAAVELAKESLGSRLVGCKYKIHRLTYEHNGQTFVITR